MIDWINNFFGIDNEVSVPTLISLIVFITGGIINYIFSKIKGFNDRKINRTTFNLLIQEVYKDLNTKKKSIAAFYPQISVKNENNFIIKQTTISYLDTIFEIDFKETYYSFRKKIFWSFYNRKLKHKAFHKIWTILRQQKYFEEQIKDSLTNLSSTYDLHLKLYNSHLEEYRKYSDRVMHKYKDFSTSPSEITLVEYLNARDVIWINWGDLGQIRTFYYYSYNNLVGPMLELDRKNSDLEITLESSNLLLSCYLEYMEIENTLTSYQKQFIIYHQLYRNNERTLKKCLMIMK